MSFDIVGFTKLCIQHGPEKGQLMLQEYLDKLEGDRIACEANRATMRDQMVAALNERDEAWRQHRLRLEINRELVDLLQKKDDEIAWLRNDQALTQNHIIKLEDELREVREQLHEREKSIDELG